ncbi:MAG: serine/threonine protein kinase, partial [Candidatus Aminicenantes bacterium]|nr:serine/threonine protein kinase [Candidatus Aminicenantes bacterium]
MNCPRCEYDNPADTNYCGKCGMPLTLDGETAAYDPESIKTLFRDIKTGTTFSDRYEVIDELGKGGMGAVYKVYDKKIKEKIALKLIRPEIALNEKTAERFRNEIKLARRITHRNVCRMYDLGEDGPSLYITMEYISGQDLRNMLRMTPHFSVGTAVNIAKQVCQGLVESHRLGVVHRDLKPQNIMIDTEGSVKIMDFGIARSLRTSSVTATGVLIGTPDYMSPEQAEGKDVDERTDIYSLGVILFEMVTKKVPFTGETALSVALKHKTEAPEHPAALNTAVSPELNRIILKCLEKDKNKRYAGAAELLDDLSGVEQGIPTIEKIIPVQKPRTSSEITVILQPRKYIIPVFVGLILISLVLVFWKKVIPPKPTLSEESSVANTSLPTRQKSDKSKTVPEAIMDGLSRSSRPGGRISGLKRPSFSDILSGIIVKSDGNFSEFEKIQVVMQLLGSNPLRMPEEITEENIKSFI